MSSPGEGRPQQTADDAHRVPVNSEDELRVLREQATATEQATHRESLLDAPIGEPLDEDALMTLVRGTDMAVSDLPEWISSPGRRALGSIEFHEARRLVENSLERDTPGWRQMATPLCDAIRCESPDQREARRARETNLNVPRYHPGAREIEWRLWEQFPQAVAAWTGGDSRRHAGLPLERILVAEHLRIETLSHAHDVLRMRGTSLSARELVSLENWVSARSEMFAIADDVADCPESLLVAAAKAYFEHDLAQNAKCFLDVTRSAGSAPTAAVPALRPRPTHVVRSPDGLAWPAYDNDHDLARDHELTLAPRNNRRAETKARAEKRKTEPAFRRGWR